MVALRHVRDLLVEEPAQEGRSAHLGAASGLVARDDAIFVVSDDDVALARFALGDPAPGSWVQLDEATLPLDHAERKAAKPDLEALTELPGTAALLAIGSGATPARDRGWVVPVAEPGVREISLRPLYERLRAELPDLNVEGAAFQAEGLWLAQRGNGVDGRNALLELERDAALAGIERGELTAEPLRDTRDYELGRVGDVPLTFSDLAPGPDGRLLFCAVAEAVASTYLDGPCVGAAIGLLDPRRGEVEQLEPLTEPHKVEGIAPRRDRLLLVVDDDDPGTAAPLLEADWPDGWR